MNEGAIREGRLDEIREYEVRGAPISLGSAAHCTIQLDGDEGAIAPEEARLWVHRGRLVYHKLTTLSAMATEGAASGWLFLESGEDVALGPYRIIFQAGETEPEESPGSTGAPDVGRPAAGSAPLQPF